MRAKVRSEAKLRDVFRGSIMHKSREIAKKMCKTCDEQGRSGTQKWHEECLQALNNIP